MTPRLPTELLAHILALACQDEAGLARRETRDGFSLVCKEWCQSMDRGAEVGLNEVDELERVVVWLSGGSKRPLGSEAGAKIKSVYVKLTNPNGWRREDPRQPRELNKLLKLLDRLELLELELRNDVLSTKWREKGNLYRLAPRSIAHLANLKSLTLTGVGFGAGFTLALKEFEDLVGSLPALERVSLASLTINCGRSWRDKAQLRHPARALSVSLSHVSATTGRYEVRAFVPALPAQVRSLSFSHEHLYSYARNNYPDYARELVTHQDHLTELSLLDPLKSNYTAGPPLNHGGLAAALERLVNLRKLEISPAATNALDQTLAPLAKLRRLSVIQGFAVTTAPPSAAQLLAVLNGPAPLERVAISASLVEAWPEQDQQQVAAAAEQHGVAFVKL